MKKKTKDILIKAGVILLCVGALGGIVSLTSSVIGGGHKGPGPGGNSSGSYKEIEPTFLLGGINDANGNYESSNLSLFNRFPIETQSLKVSLNPNYRMKFQVFFYDKQDTFVSKTELSTVGAEVKVPKDTQARIEIIPDSGAMQWDTAPIIANSVKVFASKDAKVDVQGTKGIMTTAYNPTENGNLLNVLNGTYKGNHFTINVKNGTFRFSGKKLNDDTGYEIVDMPLIDEISKSFTFLTKVLDNTEDLFYHNFRKKNFVDVKTGYQSTYSPKFRDIETSGDIYTHYSLKLMSGDLNTYVIPGAILGNHVPAA